MLDELKRFVDPLRQFGFKAGAVIGEGLLQLTLSVFIAFFFFRDGEAIMARVRGAVSRIAPTRGLHMLEVANATTRAVVYGILGTALAQGRADGDRALHRRHQGRAAARARHVLPVAGADRAAAGVDSHRALADLRRRAKPAWGIFLLVWGAVIVSSVDNVLKPMIISRGSDLPFILVMLGVFGGVVAFGFIGVFLGPVLLALAFALVKEWAAPTARTKSLGPAARGRRFGPGVS